MTPKETQDAARLTADVYRWFRSACPDCCRAICGHEVLAAVAMGMSDAPLCVTCLAGRLDQPAEAFIERIAAYVEPRACYRSAWDAACVCEGQPAQLRPPCLWPDATPRPTDACPSLLLSDGLVVEDAAWDAGDMSCGDLALALRGRLASLAPGQTLRVRALDPAAPEDLPAWCRLTGNHLRSHAHPDYWIRKKG